MKVCPHCSFINDEAFPTCVYCNKSLADVPSVPAEDPDHPEHQIRLRQNERFALARRQERWAGIIYALVVTLTAYIPGFVEAPIPLLLYTLGAWSVVLAISRGWCGQLTASFVQGILTSVLLFIYGPIHPFSLFMLAGHIIGAGFLWHWTDLIHSTTR